MPQQKQQQPNDNELLNNIRRGNSAEIRVTTLMHGWLKQCQNAQRDGAAAFSRWVGEQTSLIDTYAREIVGTPQAQTAGTGTQTTGGTQQQGNQRNQG